MPTQVELYAQAHQDSGYIPSEPRENKSEGVSEQNAPQTGEDNTKVKAGNPSPASVGVTPGNLMAKIDLAKETERMANQHKITEATRGYDYQGKIYDEMISRLNAPESPEEKAKREKKERSKKIIGAVSDGLSALSNLYFTSQYAPNMYNHEKGSQLNSTMAAIEKAKAEREKNDEAYYNLALKIGDLQNQRAKTVREMEAEAEARKIALQRAEDAHKAAEAERALDQYKQRGAIADAERKESDRDYSRVKADNAPEEMRLKNRNMELQGQVHKSTINKNVAQTNKANSEVKGEKPYAYDRNGKKHYFEKEETAEKFARANGTWVEVDDITVTDTDSELNGKSSRTVTKKKGYSQKPSGFNKEDYKRNKGQQSAPTPPPLN